MPKAYFIENIASNEVLFNPQNKDLKEIWGGDINNIFVGIDIITGYFLVEGNTYLYNELFAFRELDGVDLQNYYLVAKYISCLKRFNFNIR